MNPLEKLKQKLMAKPTLNEQKPVVVAIKGETKMKTTKPAKQVEKQGEKEEGEVSEEVQAEESVGGPETATKMIVVDETNKGYNRNDFLMKLTENKKTKVKVKPIMEAVEASKQTEPISAPAPIEVQPPVKKARKVAKKKTYYY